MHELAAIQAELDRLEKRDADLETALDEVEHDSRRCADALERVGWRSDKAEARGVMLAESRAMILADREKIRALYAKSTERLNEIQKCLKQN